MAFFCHDCDRLISPAVKKLPNVKVIFLRYEPAYSAGLLALQRLASEAEWESDRIFTNFLRTTAFFYHHRDRLISPVKVCHIYLNTLKMHF
ncbi:MAG: hypothetical protein V7K98_09800 [Nostoc sp.]|uniref:hypothetical protein n=1 Tax=Nostoc sp. TaxID=1180 RepID=UPI002FF6BA3A